MTEAQKILGMNTHLMNIRLIAGLSNDSKSQMLHDAADYFEPIVEMLLKAEGQIKHLRGFIWERYDEGKFKDTDTWCNATEVLQAIKAFRRGE